MASGHFSAVSSSSRYLSDQGVTIISGMDYGIDAAAHDGALEGCSPTIAGNYGREVFAVPGSVQVGNHAGCHQLIRGGAALANDPASIMQELGWFGVKYDSSRKRKTYQPSSENEAKILELLHSESLRLDELTETCGLTMPELSPILLGLELLGVIERLPSSRYQLSSE